MRYTVDIKEQVRLMRKKGKSLLQISKVTKIPHTTIHDWTRDIVLTPEQVNLLQVSANKLLQEGRIRVQKKNKEIRKILVDDLNKKGKEEVGTLTSRELFVAGVALYWAEGFKNVHERRLGFCNSDPDMVRFYIHWLEKSLGIKKKDLVLRLALNSSYRDKTIEIEKYWSELLNIPLGQFSKTFYQSSIWKKTFNTEDYRGVLRIHVKGSLNHFLKMKGQIKALKDFNLPG